MPASLIEYRSEIHKLNANTATVEAAFTLTGAAGKSNLIIGSWRGERISQLSMNGRQSVESAIYSDAALQIPFASADNVVSYRVTSSERELSRVPLPVPSALPRPGERPVHLSVFLPHGDVPSGDLFPSFTWTAGSQGTVELSSVPSLLVLHSKPAGDVSAIDSLLGFHRVTDGVMLLLLVAGSAWWWLRSRRLRKKSQPL